MIVGFHGFSWPAADALRLADTHSARAEAPKGGDTAFPRVIFSFKAVPKWEITLSESGSVFEILRLEAEPHYVEVEAATQVASSLPVRSFM